MKKIKIHKGRKYSICSCGLSNILPLCDNAHRKYNEDNKTNYKSVKIILDISNKSKLVKITDMLARKTPYRENIPLFYIYDDGTVEKKIIIE